MPFSSPMPDPDQPPAAPSAAAFMPDSPVASRIHPSPNHGARRDGAAPDSIILHYTGMARAADALLWLANPLSEVSCHYFVFENGRIFQMVPEVRRAWHAGKSLWHGETDMNSRSIGIEIANPGHDLAPLPDGSPNPLPPLGPPFTEAQIEAVIRLVADIKARLGISNARILAHSDIAPGRKIDPGERFPWARLAAAGLGLWPDPRDLDRFKLETSPSATSFRQGDEGMPIRALQALFARFGYGIEITGVYDQRTCDVVSAFQRHWRPDKVDGVVDGETIERLRALHSAATT